MKNLPSPPKICRLAFPIALLLLWIFAPQKANAHKLQVEPIVVIVRPQQSFLTVEMRGNGEDIIQAIQVRDSERRGNDFTPAVSARLQSYLNQKLSLKEGQKALQGQLIKLDYSRPDPLDYTTSKFSAILRYGREAQGAKEKFVVASRLFDYLPNAQTILSIGGVQKTLNAGESIEFDPAAVTANLWNNIKDFTIMGAEHIFTGPDHMLFIVALLLISTSFWPLAKTLTGFTISHSITLILSALSIVVLNNQLVDILVALSIIFVGLENIFWKDAARHRFWVAAAFGLVHGFGFSYTLREIGLPEQGLAWCLLSFNLGVEIAQIMLCAVAFPIMLYFRRKFEHEAQYGGMGWPKAMHLASWGVVLMGGYWLAQRLTA